MHRVLVSATGERPARVAVGLCLLLAGGTIAEAQSRRTISVTEFGTGMPLTNAEVQNLTNGAALFTNSSGEAVLPERWATAVPLRIRQIGYRFADTTLARDDSSRVIRIALRKVAYTLPTVPIAVGMNCALKPEPEAALLAATALEQLQMAAERYNTFKKLYPFRAHLERRSKSFDSLGRTRRDTAFAESTPSGDWGERYAPDRIVEDSWGRFTVQILFLAHLADPAFWSRHCFEAVRFERLAGRSVLRLRFAPVARVRDPDWEGWALLDSATSELRRLEFRLARIPAGTRPQKLEAYTTFVSPVPNIVLPESTVAIWWRNTPASDSAPPDVLQLLRLVRVEYRRGSP